MRSGYKSRSREHHLSPDLATEMGISTREASRKYFYKTLLQVQINHSYYNGADDLCTDFILTPTASCVELLTNLGLLFRPQKAGFSILYNDKAKQQLFNYLDAQHAIGYWSRLSFIGIADNPYFVNFSEMSFNTNPSIKNFYLSNVQAHCEMTDVQSQVVLNNASYVTQPTQEYYDTVPMQFAVQFGNATRIVVLDISGEVICSYPQCIPKGLVSESRWSAINTTALTNYRSENPDNECTERETVYIDLAREPQGLYEIQWYNNDVLISQQYVIYTVVAKIPFMFMDLMFNRPENEEGGIYPVNLEDRNITAIDYHINFNRRSVYWLYWVVPQSWQTISNLSIIDDGDGEIAFNGPFAGQLPDGKAAWYFVSEQRLALEQISPYRFNLDGQLEQTSTRTLIGPLPVASGTELLSQFENELSQFDNELNKKYSAIYVYI